MIYHDMESFVGAVANQYNLTYSDALKDIDKITRKTAKEMSEAIRQASPKKSGDYSRGWTVSGKREDDGTLSMTVYNKSRYYLTHLLEYDHFAGTDQHIVRGHEHIGPQVEKFNKLFIERLTEKWGKVK